MSYMHEFLVFGQKRASSYGGGHDSVVGWLLNVANFSSGLFWFESNFLKSLYHRNQLKNLARNHYDKLNLKNIFWNQNVYKMVLKCSNSIFIPTLIYHVFFTRIYEPTAVKTTQATTRTWNKVGHVICVSYPCLWHTTSERFWS